MSRPPAAPHRQIQQAKALPIETRKGKVSVNTSSYRSTREVVVTETMQIGIVVRDLDAALRRYVDDYGIGPWQVYEFNAENAKDLHSTANRLKAPGASPSPWSAR